MFLLAQSVQSKLMSHQPGLKNLPILGRQSLNRLLNLRKCAHAGKNIPSSLTTPNYFSDMGKEVSRSQAVTVLAISMAIVMGPTPPGTGVIAAQRSATAS